ncbi:sensor histidine kinase [Streptomyces sp. 4N509B]|uniref:sensor histidine kinase n=1 Tax=Streptomyces sp. 4N509B TaxID=3457413 RepID=UPI003FD619A6
MPVTETKPPDRTSRLATGESLRSDLRSARSVARGLGRDLFGGAFVVRPLRQLPENLPQLDRLPPTLREPARWLPHILLVSLAFTLAMLTVAGWDVNGAWQRSSVLDALLVGATVISALFWRMGAFWLSFLGGWLIGASTVSWGAAPWGPSTFVMHVVVMAVVAARSRPRVAAEMWLLTVVLGAGFDVATDLWSPTTTPAMLVVSFVVLLAVVLVQGWWESQREVAVQVAVTAKERSKRTLLEERTTIARELHDVVAHHMSVVAIQAEAAPYRVADPPPELVRSFAIIRQNALTALAELRRVLGVVRAADHEAPDAPQPTLADLDDLLANVREAGVPVEKAVTGAVRELPQGLELSAYRIVQEALSNCIRHAPGAAARVEVSYVLGGLGLRVVNGPPSQPAPPSPGAGHGLTGMRERVTMLGGEMTAGPTDEGGYETAVFIPVPSGATTEGPGSVDTGEAGGTGETGESEGTAGAAGTTRDIGGTGGAA